MSARRPLRTVTSVRGVPAAFRRSLVWRLGLGAFGLSWSITTVAAHLPPLLNEFTTSQTLIGLVLALEGVFALFVPLLVGPMSDATETSFGRRRPYMLLALVPMAVTLAAVAFMPSLFTAAVALCAFFFAYYIYEPPYRGLYPDCLHESVYGARRASSISTAAPLSAARSSGAVSSSPSGSRSPSSSPRA